MNSTSRLAIMHYRPTCSSFQLSYNFSSTISVILKMMFLTTPTLVLYLNFVDQTQRHLSRNVLLSIRKYLSHQFQPASNNHAVPLSPSHPTIDTTNPLINIFLNTLTNLPVIDGKWDNTTHIVRIGSITYFKIKSYQLTTIGRVRSSSQPSPCLTLAHVNHWTDQTAKLPHSEEHNQ